MNVLYRDHTRHWQDNLYVYAVLSRRSGGVSVGINLNPDKACNFDCIYCQVDRTTPPMVRDVDPARLDAELRHTLAEAASGELFRHAPLDAVPADMRVVRDIAFSGDGEPTTCTAFHEAVRIAARARLDFKLDQCKLVLITDACYLKRDSVRAALKDFDAANGEIWAKLDAGTDAYYEQVNRPNYPLDHVIDNIVDVARVRPIVIQSLFMRVHGQPPPMTEVDAYCDRLHDIVSRGGVIKLVQLYTIARRTTEPYATPLTNDELDGLAQRVSGQISLPIARFYSAA
ncbi:MAG: radical SAM protein [Phycisphaerae bacterium]|nr:radical SAM protein [Phycisphaerae bacterium]